MSQTSVLDILVPSLNEEENLVKLKQSLDQQSLKNIRVILSDGGSSDSSIKLAKEFGWLVLNAPNGRAKQLNEGLTRIEAEYFLVLHADSQFYSTKQLEDSLEQLKSLHKRQANNRAVGHWGLQFERKTNEYPWAFRYPEEKSLQNRRYVVNGDQGMLFATDFFKSYLVHFNENLSFMEDQEMAERVFQLGYWYLLPHKLQTSARRFESEGFHQRYILMAMMMGLYWCEVYEFFDRAVGVYRSQEDVKKLKMWPFFKVIWVLMWKDYGIKGSMFGWYKIGTYIRKQSWQLFFFLDVSLRDELGEGKYPFLKFHDKVFYPLTNNKVCNFLNTIICFCYFMFLLGPYFYITEELLTSPTKAQDPLT